MRSVILVATFAVVGLAAAGGDSGVSVPIEPGYHSGNLLPGYSSELDDRGVSNSFELYLPKRYGAAKDVRYPIVLVLGRGATANRVWIEQQHLKEWADAQNPPAIIVGVNRSIKAGRGAVGRMAIFRDDTVIPVDDGIVDYWKIVDRIPQAHPTLRFLVSQAGFTTDSEQVTGLAQRYPSKLAGFVIGPHPYYPFGNRELEKVIKLEKDLSVAVLHVTHEAYARGRPETPYAMNSDDRFDPLLWERAYLSSLHRSGNPFALIESIDWGVREASLHEALSYLLRSGLQFKAGVTEAERAAGKQALLSAAMQASAIQDVAERERRYRSLLAVRGAAEWPEMQHQLNAWRELVPQAAELRTEPLFRATFLETMKAHPLIMNSPTALERVTKQLEDFQATPAYRKEAAAQNAVRAAAIGFTNDQHAGKDIAGLEKTIAAFQAVQESGAGTLPAKEAQAWLAFLTKLREGSKKQGR